MIKLTIDGKQIETQEGKTILEAALEHGISIPSLCYLASVGPIGSCRLCLVEVEGVEKPIASCTTPAVEGLVVKTQSDRLTTLRKEALEFMLINHPLDCPICDKAGECRLQDLAYELDVTAQDFQLEKTSPSVDYLSPLIERNEARCIRCGRCVSICHEIQGCGAYRFTDTGYEAAVDTVDSRPLDCDFCGQCITACPTGALINKLFKYRSRVWELEKIPTVCPFCGAGCKIKLNVKRQKVYRVTPEEETITNFGPLCSRGTFGFGFVHNRERLHTPLIRRSKELAPVSWEEALDFAAQQLETIKEKNGPEAIAGLGSARVTNEENYLFQKFFRIVVGGNNLDSYARTGYGPALEVIQASTGTITPNFSFAEVEGADCILIVGTDLSVEMPVPSLQVIKAAREGKAKLINCCPRGTKLDRFAHMRLRYRPGTETVLLAGFARVIVDERLQDNSFIESRTEGYDGFVQSLRSVSLAEVSGTTDVALNEIVEAARTLARSERICILFGYDLITQASSKEAVSSAANLALLKGIVSKPGSGLYLVTEKNNLRGVVEMGVLPDRLPGFKPLSEAAEFEKVLGKSVPSKPGKPFPGMMDAIARGEIKALYVMGTDPLVEFPGGGS